MEKNYMNIPAEKFQFAKRSIDHDSKLSTKPIGYFQDAFRRFCKNKGAVVGGIVIAFLVLFAIIAPFCTPFQPAYYDMVFRHVTPKMNFFVENGIDFWDGYKEKETSYVGYLKDFALASETGKDIIKRGEYTVTEDATGGVVYSYRYDTYSGVGFGRYKEITKEEYEAIQRYQNETGRQVLYPVVSLEARKTMHTKNQDDANIYYVMENPKDAVARPKLDENGNVIPNYWKYEAGSPSGLVAEYNSLRIEGDDGVVELVPVINDYGQYVKDENGNIVMEQKHYHLLL